MSQEKLTNPDNKQPVSVFDKDVEFNGWYGNDKNPTEVHEIRIGLFYPENSANPHISSITKAADLAIEEINKSGGYKGLPYKLIKRWSDDPWGAGSKEMIKLVFEDSVWAVIGSLDGDATHIAEQIATKGWLPLISPLSADPTLNYIRIPWIFRLPPDYQAQATLIVEQGINKHFLKRVGLISTTNHDGRIFANEIRNAMEKMKHSLAFHFQVSAKQRNLTEIIRRALTFRPDGLILYLDANEIEKLISELQNKELMIPVFLPWISGLKSEVLSKNENLFFIKPFSQHANSGWNLFQKKYNQRFGADPPAAAAFTYDAVYLIKHAIEKSGLNQAAIRDAIANTDYINPVSGKIFWDNTGGNMIQPVLINMNNEYVLLSNIKSNQKID